MIGTRKVGLCAYRPVQGWQEMGSGWRNWACRCGYRVWVTVSDGRERGRVPRPYGERDAMRRAYRAVTVLAVAAATLTAGAAAAAAPAAGQAGQVTLYSARVFDTPEAMVAGPDGALWYVNTIGNSIGRMTTSG